MTFVEYPTTLTKSIDDGNVHEGEHASLENNAISSVENFLDYVFKI